MIRHVMKKNILIYMLLFVFVYAVRRVIFLDANGPDDVFFCYSGKILSAGARMYTDVGDVKGPLMYYTFSLFDKLSGGITPFILRLYSVFVVFLTSVLAYHISLKISRNFLLSAAVAFYWGLMDFVVSFSDVYACFFLFAGFYIFLFYIENENRLLLLFTGLFISLMLLYNQRAFPYIGIPGLFIIARYRLSRRMFADGFILAAGFILPLLAAVLFFYRTGSIADMLFWIYYKAGSYNSTRMWYYRWLLLPFQKVFVTLFLQQLGVLFIFFVIIFKKSVAERLYREKPVLLFLLLWVSVGFAATLIDGKTTRRYNLYFILPAIIMGFQGLWLFVKEKKIPFLIAPSGKTRAYVFILLFLLAIIPPSAVIYSESMKRVQKAEERRTGRPASAQYARYLHDNVKGRCIYVFPSHKGDDCLVNYPSATRFVYGDFHLLDIRSASSEKYRLDESWEILLDEIRRNKPSVIVDTTGNEFYPRDVLKTRREMDKLFNAGPGRDAGAGSVPDLKTLQGIRLYFTRNHYRDQYKVLPSIESHLNEFRKYILENYRKAGSVSGNDFYIIKDNSR